MIHELDVKSISSRLGHSSTSFTMDVYGHVLQQHQSRTALSVDRLLGNLPAKGDAEPADS